MLDLFEKVNTLVFDIDGVLTDGSVTLLPTGEQIRKMNVKDGYALQLAIKRGLNIAVISGGSSIESKERLHGLGIEHVYLKSRNKWETLQEYLLGLNETTQHVLYMGDDIPDYEVMSKVLLPTCPIDACQEVKSICKYISPLKGGEACVRDVIEKVMKLKGLWFESDSQHDFSW